LFAHPHILSTRILREVSVVFVFGETPFGPPHLVVSVCLVYPLSILVFFFFFFFFFTSFKSWLFSLKVPSLPFKKPEKKPVRPASRGGPPPGFPLFCLFAFPSLRVKIAGFAGGGGYGKDGGGLFFRFGPVNPALRMASNVRSLFCYSPPPPADLRVALLRFPIFKVLCPCFLRFPSLPFWSFTSF